MKAYVITIEGNELSEEASRKCIESSWKVKNEFSIERFDATTPDKVNQQLTHEYVLRWNYPWEGQLVDFATGLTKSAYPTKNKNARIACALSHYRLWDKCRTEGEDMMILEHDAIFVKKVPYEILLDSRYGIVGINNPLGATRRAMVFDKLVGQSTAEVTNVPRIDNMNIPQGLAGNSAYIIKPWAAEEMIKLVKEHGLWPNDAIMCYQLFPLLGVTKTYYTEVQGLKSTTSL